MYDTHGSFRVYLGDMLMRWQWNIYYVIFHVLYEESHTKNLFRMYVYIFFFLLLFFVAACFQKHSPVARIVIILIPTGYSMFKKIIFLIIIFKSMPRTNENVGYRNRNERYHFIYIQYRLFCLFLHNYLSSLPLLIIIKW